MHITSAALGLSLIARDYARQHGQVTGGVTRIRSLRVERKQGVTGEWRSVRVAFDFECRHDDLGFVIFRFGSPPT